MAFERIEKAIIQDIKIDCRASSGLLKIKIDFFIPRDREPGDLFIRSIKSLEHTFDLRTSFKATETIERMERNEASLLAFFEQMKSVGCLSFSEMKDKEAEVVITDGEVTSFKLLEG